jgi:alpha-glucosidase (family GH31 glycosyl hydrolase)
MASDYKPAAATRVRVQYLAANAVRITHAPAEATAFPPDRPWVSHVLLPASGVSAEDCQLVVEVADGLVRIGDRAGGVVLDEARPPTLGKARRVQPVPPDHPATEADVDLGRVPGTVSMAFAIRPDEGFYGGGEWFDAFRRERGTLRLRTRDAFAMLQQRATYSAIPLFLSSRGYGLFLLNSHESTWRIDPGHGRLEIAALGPGADYIAIHGPAFRDILATYTALTGRPPLVPRWALGLMATGYPQEHQGVVLERVHEHRLASIPLDAVILDYHWEERFHNLRWREALFPNPDGLIGELKVLGVRLGLILTPFLNRRNRPLQRLLLNLVAHNQPRGVKRTDERDLPGYAEAKEKGYLAHPRARWWFGLGGMMDFTNPAAADWWNARMRPLYDQGVAFFKNDDGEYLPFSANSALGLRGREYHNLYGFFYSRALYEGMAALDDRRPFVYARSVWAGSQRYPAMFLGDQKPTFAHIRSTMRAGLNLALLGFSYWTADVFGLDGKTTPETHMRYAQWALFCPIARYFWRPPEVDNTRFPWSHGFDVEANFRTYANLRYRLLPYYYRLAWESYRSGLPIIRPLLLEFPADPRFADMSDQVMLGDSLLLAPVVAGGATQRRIALPEGTWHDFWSTTSYAGGGEIEYAAPLDRLPLLVRGGTILPMGPELPNIPDDHRFDHLFLHIWPPYPAQGLLYDDDGRTRAYQRGEYSVTHFVAEGDERRVTVRLAAAEGDFPGQVLRRQVEVILHRAAAPSAVQVNGRPAVDWRHELSEGTVHIPVRCPVDGETVVIGDWRLAISD